MLRNVDIAEISDGKLYGLQDMVRADCRDCTGCSECCRGMGSSILLDPLDIARLTLGTGKSFEAMIDQETELILSDGAILPSLKLSGTEETCTFLNAEGRCSIHPYRPGICRIFPLGRLYENGSFRYFLQIHECVKKDRSKTKVRQWIDTPDPVRYDQYICDWHYFVKETGEKMPSLPENEQKMAAMYILKLFYSKPYDLPTDGNFYPAFYRQFYERLEEARETFA